MYARIVLSILFSVGLVFSQHNMLIKNKFSGSILKIDVADIESVAFEDVVKDTNCVVRTTTHQILDWNKKPVYLVKVTLDPYIPNPNLCSSLYTALNKNNTKYSGYTDQNGMVTLTLYMPIKDNYGGSCTSDGCMIRCDKPLIYIDFINNVHVWRYK